jgi:hypothetical protein
MIVRARCQARKEVKTSALAPHNPPQDLVSPYLVILIT